MATATSSPPSMAPSFMILPAEIRSEVYKEYFSCVVLRSTDISTTTMLCCGIDRIHQYQSGKLPQILSVSKQICSEALPVWFSMMTVGFVRSANPLVTETMPQHYLAASKFLYLDPRSTILFRDDVFPSLEELRMRLCTHMSNLAGRSTLTVETEDPKDEVLIEAALAELRATTAYSKLTALASTSSAPPKVILEVMLEVGSFGERDVFIEIDLFANKILRKRIKPPTPSWSLRDGSST